MTSPLTPPCIAVVGLGFGDEGKGATVDFLTRHCLDIVALHNRRSPDSVWQAPLVIRYNGGPQAAHRVVTPDGIVHVFAQLGSGSFLPGVETWLSRFMAVDVLTLGREAEVLAQKGVADPLARLSLELDCVLVTPWHKAANRIQELLRTERHGTCGMGVGQAMLDAEAGGRPVLRARDLLDEARLLHKMQQIQSDKREMVRSWYRAGVGREGNLWADPRLERSLETLEHDGLPLRVAELHRQLLNASGLRLVEASSLEGAITDRPVIFEGAQGILLDREGGFFPHVTPSHTTLRNVWQLLPVYLHERVLRVGVMRAYHTRHGEGPFPCEDRSLTRSRLDAANGSDGWQGRFRVGPFDAVLARYARALSGPLDALVINCLDRVKIGEACWVDGWRLADGARVDSLQALPPDATLDQRNAWTQQWFSARPEAATAEAPPSTCGTVGLSERARGYEEGLGRAAVSPVTLEGFQRRLAMGIGQTFGAPVMAAGLGEGADQHGWLSAE